MGLPRRLFAVGAALVALAPSGDGPAAEKADLRPNLVPVRSVQEMARAVDRARPGDVIVVAPGIYRLAKSIHVDSPGRAAARITLKAARAGTVRLEVAAVQGFLVSAPYWTFENLKLVGVCRRHHDCEHAFHLVGGAHATIIRNSRLIDFNAAIKGNGRRLAGRRVYPNDVLIDGNTFRNLSPRRTTRPVSLIDVVGGERWIVRANLFVDFAKARGNRVSYGAFLKGNSRDGLFERNLVVCEHNHTGGIRIGLSFGGGGGGDAGICQHGTCSPQHTNGTMRNNVIMNCRQDVGIYLNQAKNTKLHHNILYNTRGIDARYPTTSAEVANNVLMGEVRARAGAAVRQFDNLVGLSVRAFRRFYADPEAGDFTPTATGGIVDRGRALVGLDDDFCGNRRDDGRPDLGAFEAGGDPNCYRVLDRLRQ